MTREYHIGQAPKPSNYQHRSMLGAVVLSLLTIAPLSIAPAQQASATISKTTTQKTKSAPLVDRDQISITIEGSRTQVTAGSGLGIIADIKNVSSESTVYLEEKSVRLTLPPEMLAASEKLSSGYFPLFPTEAHPETHDTNQFYIAQFKLEPGESYRVSWAEPGLTPRSSTANGFWQGVGRYIASEMDFLFFTPGDYSVNVSVKYRTNSPSSNKSGCSCPSDSDHSAVASKIFHVSAPQFVVLFGAGIGGLIAYFIFPQSRSTAKYPDDPGLFILIFLIKHVSSILGAILLSAIVTILLSRVSESQFLIRVTVNDFWGAIAVGFIANYLGATLLERIVQSGNPSARSIRQQSGDSPPIVSFAKPVETGKSFSTSSPLISLEGTASDDTGIAQVRWKNTTTGVEGEAALGTGTTSRQWKVPEVSLQAGRNEITATASDTNGNWSNPIKIFLDYQPPETVTGGGASSKASPPSTPPIVASAQVSPQTSRPSAAASSAGPIASILPSGSLPGPPSPGPTTPGAPSPAQRDSSVGTQAPTTTSSGGPPQGSDTTRKDAPHSDAQST